MQSCTKAVENTSHYDTLSESLLQSVFKEYLYNFVYLLKLYYNGHRLSSVNSVSTVRISGH